MAEKKPSADDRLDRIEYALGAALGVDISAHDPEAVVLERQRLLEEAEAEAEKIVKKAVEKASKPLTQEQRLERVERVIASTGRTDV